jgi:uncharacterized protein YaaR (DUF327 family)
MRIADVGARAAGMQGMDGHEGPKLQVDPTQAFSRRLSDLGADACQQHIAEMMQTISEQGKRLSQRADMQEFIRYRELIAALMHEVVSNAFAFKRRNAFDARGRQRIFVLVHKVNAKLDEMARGMLEEQKDNLRILKDIEEIRGMLVDMLL